MSDRYLWDGSGPPDPDVERLEDLLRVYRHDAPLGERRAPAPPWWRGRNARIAAAGVAIAAAAAVAVLALRSDETETTVVAPPGSLACTAEAEAGWSLEVLAGAPACGSDPAPPRGVLPVGQRLVTDATSRAELRVGELGTVIVEPDSEVQLGRAGAESQRMELLRGTIRASIDAPPRLFVVGTPAGDAIDLGCEYTLTVDDQGIALLYVDVGWVSLEHAGRAVDVPAGWGARTHPERGPGAPFREVADQRLRGALARYERNDDREAFDTVLEHASTKDAVTVWHLATSARDSELRGRALSRLAHLAPPPPELPPDPAACTPKQLDTWRASLDGEDR